MNCKDCDLKSELMHIFKRAMIGGKIGDLSCSCSYSNEQENFDLKNDLKINLKNKKEYDLKDIDYNKFLELTENCCKTYQDIIKDKEIKNILCVSRGGLVFAQYFLYMLDLKLPVFTINFDKSKNYILQKPILDLTENYLLMDDINDSSETFNKIMNSYASNNIIFLPLIERYSASYKSICPNILTNDAYVKFPWDIIIKD